MPIRELGKEVPGHKGKKQKEPPKRLEKRPSTSWQEEKNFPQRRGRLDLKREIKKKCGGKGTTGNKKDRLAEGICSAGLPIKERLEAGEKTKEEENADKGG